MHKQAIHGKNADAFTHGKDNALVYHKQARTSFIQSASPINQCILSIRKEILDSGGLICSSAVAALVVVGTVVDTIFGRPVSQASFPF